MDHIDGWTETECQKIAADALALLWDYCDLLAANLDSTYVQWWTTKGEQMRAECTTLVKASNTVEVTNVAGFVSEYRHFLKDTESDEDLMFWLTETVAQIHNRLTKEANA